MDLPTPVLPRLLAKECRETLGLLRLREWRVDLIMVDRTETSRPLPLALVDFELVARDTLSRPTLSELVELELLAEALSAMRLMFGDDPRVGNS
jgi:hypothetical protein